MKKSELAFHNAYDEFHAKIHHYLERMVGKDEAEDLTQIRAIRSLAWIKRPKK